MGVADDEDSRDDLAPTDRHPPSPSPRDRALHRANTPPDVNQAGHLLLMGRVSLVSLILNKSSLKFLKRRVQFALQIVVDGLLFLDRGEDRRLGVLQEPV